MRFVFTSYAGSPDYTDPGGWLERIEGYTGILESLGREHQVTGIEHIDHEGEYEHRGIRYFFLRQRNRVDRFPYRLHKKMRALQPDVIFINGFIFPLQVIQLRLQLGRKVRIIILHRAERPMKGYRKYFQRWADRCVDAYFFSAGSLGDAWIEAGIIERRSKIHEIIQGSSVFLREEKQVARGRLGLQGTPIFLWVGRLEANKDPLTVLDAFLRFHLLYPDARLYMIYQEEMLIDDVRTLIASRRNGAEAIILVGRVPHAGLEAWFNAADFMISGSHSESNGVAICEGMSCGCVPVITDIPSFRRMTGPGACGLLYEAGNTDDLFAALLRTMDIDIAAEQASTRKRFEDELSFDAIARKTNEVVAAFFPVRPELTAVIFFLSIISLVT